MEHVWGLGIRAVWEMYSRCPCGQSAGNAADLVCPICGGRGFEFHDPQTIRVVTDSMGREFQPYDRGNPWETGVAWFTCRTEHGPGMYDRVTIIDATVNFHELRERVGTTEEFLRYPIIPTEVRVGPPKDPTDEEVYTEELDVLYLRAGTADHTAGAVLVKGVDFDITDRGTIDWTKGDEKEVPTTPPIGAMFAVTYKTYPVYRVIEMPHQARAQRSWFKAEDEFVLPILCQFKAKLDWLTDIPAAPE
jgi:hypothetical protein